MDYNEIVGQKEIIGKLKKAVIDNKVGHAYIFSGPKGIGKRTVARAFAHMLLCLMPGENGPCGVCRPCILWNENSNPDFYEIETSDANISIDDIRSMQAKIVVRPLYSDRKVYLITDADKMTIQAQNCLLKTLEEPPGYTVIILTTANYEALLGTVRSRGTKYTFGKYSHNEVRAVLKSKFYQDSLKETIDDFGNSKDVVKDAEKMEFIVHYSDGVIGTALELAVSSEFASLREKAFEILLKLSSLDGMEYFDICDFFDDNKSNIDNLLDIMSIYYRDLLMARVNGKENMLINSDKKSKIIEAARKYSVQTLVRNIEAIEFTRRSIKQNANYQLAVETMIMKLREEI
ncbi:MAG TPA: DNA polymerase III subunit delta' C-terminal domain-containing protein [Clostridiales bacterium]|nr:DNA polymerase III subunit delta' C-terminal domain-containing protein [Clostridiales bacterium]